MNNDDDSTWKKAYRAAKRREHDAGRAGCLYGCIEIQCFQVGNRNDPAADTPVNTTILSLGMVRDTCFRLF